MPAKQPAGMLASGVPLNAVPLGAMKSAKECVTKLDAARRQLREAVLLFFERRDPIAIHALAAGALQVLSDVAKAKGDAGLLKSGEYIREGYQKQWFQSLSEAQNFFKHADKDPDAVLDFKPAVTPFFLLDAALLEARISGKSCPAGKAYLLWFYIANPEVLIDGPANSFYTGALAQGIEPEDFDLFLNLVHTEEQAHGA